MELEGRNGKDHFDALFPSLNTPSGQNNKQVASTLRTPCWTTLDTGEKPL